MQSCWRNSLRILNQLFDRLYRALGPGYWLAVLVLITNDWWFKGSTLPDFFTGKASDLVGVFAISVVLIGIFSSPTREARSAVSSLVISSIVSVIFTAMKISDVGRNAVEFTWGFLLGPFRFIQGDWSIHPIDIVSDTSDLVAVPLAFLGAYYVRRRWELS